MELEGKLARISIFNCLDPKDLSDLVNLSVNKEYSKGEWIVYQGDRWPYLYYVNRGSLNVIKESVDGRAFTAATINEGDVFWGLAFFFDDTPMPAGLLASGDCQLCLWSREDLIPILLRNGQTSWELSRLIMKKMLRASEIVDELAFQPVAGRLANLLLDIYGNAVEGYVDRDLTLDEMGARIGSTREVVCRLLYRFAEEGAIHIKRTEFMIKDRGKLGDYIGKARQ